VEHHVTLPLSVNVVPGDQARDRVPNPAVQIEQLLADADDAKKSATQALRDRDDEQAKSTLDGTLGAIRRLRADLSPLGDEGLIGRLDEASQDLQGLRMSLDIEVAEHSMKLMTDSLAMTTRGRKSKPKATPAPKHSSSESAVRPPRDSGDVDDSGEVASG